MRQFANKSYDYRGVKLMRLDPDDKVNTVSLLSTAEVDASK